MANILYKYLHDGQHPATGLLESFRESADPELHHVAFTYDLALAALVFTRHHALEEAERLIDFYRSMPLPCPTTPDYNTAYQVRCCVPVLESALQVGPLAWVAIALMRYAEASGQLLYLQKAVALLNWVRRHVDHFHGGVVMGLNDPWMFRMSTENNWAYYAALRLAIPFLQDGPVREAFQEEKEGVRRWLSRNERNRGEGDPVKALDVYTNALLVGPTAHLEDVVMGDRAALATWAKNWLEELDALFRMPRVAGYDYTDAQEAARAGRARASWLEGTEQVVLACQTWAPFFETHGDSRYAFELLRRASLSHAHVMRCSLLIGNAVAIPNTDALEPLKTFSDGWYARPWTEPALNGTTWAYFVEMGFNPLTSSLPHVPASSPCLKV